MRRRRLSDTQKKHKGFTLVELVVAIVITAIALTFLTSIFFANPGRSIEPLLQIRATEFGRAMMEEILSKNFDENTPVGGQPPCASCTALADFGSDAGETRVSFDDVDDYNDYCDTSSPPNPGNVIDSNDVNLTADTFSQFRMSVCVSAGSDDNEKLITINMYLLISGRLSDPIAFSAYKGNY